MTCSVDYMRHFGHTISILQFVLFHSFLKCGKMNKLWASKYLTSIVFIYLRKSHPDVEHIMNHKQTQTRHVIHSHLHPCIWWATCATVSHYYILLVCGISSVWTPREVHSLAGSLFIQQSLPNIKKSLFILEILLLKLLAIKS